MSGWFIQLPVRAHSSVILHGLALLYGINSFIVSYITKNKV